MLLQNAERERHRTPWSDHELGLLRELFATETNVRTVSNILGRSQEAISTQARRLVLTKPRQPG